MIASLCLLELGDMSARFAIMLRGEDPAVNTGTWLPLNQLTGADRTQQINLQGHRVGPLAAGLISVLLRFNASLTSLNISHNGIGIEGAKSLALAIRLNASLTQVLAFPHCPSAPKRLTLVLCVCHSWTSRPTTSAMRRSPRCVRSPWVRG